MSVKFKSRIAPTPSGYLHLGNVFNFLLTWWLVRKNNGVLWLRIDDIDTPRVRPQYIEDIFDTLNWLGLCWDEGPRSAEEYYKIYAQRDMNRYRQCIDMLIKNKLVYRCICSRSELQKGKLCECATIYADHIPKVQFSYKVSTHYNRIEFNDQWSGKQRVTLSKVMPDFIVWRSDDKPAYQLYSLIDDLHNHVNVIVRGADLLHSTAAQICLAGKLQLGAFRQTRFYHHPLINAENGVKLSKSNGAFAIKNWRNSNHSPTQIFKLFSRWTNLPAEVNNTTELLSLSTDDIRFKNI